MTNILKLTDEVFDYYQNKTAGNKNISRELAELKMTRNMHLALPYNHNSGRTWYAYGQLRFAVENGVVGWIVNKRREPAVWSKDWDKYDRLTNELGLME